MDVDTRTLFLVYPPSGKTNPRRNQGMTAAGHLFLGIRARPGQGAGAAPRTVAIAAQAAVEESPDTTGQRAS